MGNHVFLNARYGSATNADPPGERIASFNASRLEVHMFNVRNGEAIVITFPNRRAWVLDCGSGNHAQSRNELLGIGIATYLAENNLELEGLVPSHPHIDHAGGYRWMLNANPPLAPKVWVIRASEKWEAATGWKPDLETAATAALGSAMEELTIRDAHRVIEVTDGTTLRFFAHHGDGVYTSVLTQIRFRDARLLFTGDVLCGYENDLLAMFDDYDFRSHVLKITHHGASSGTGITFVNRVTPGLSIASTRNHEDHRLEQDVIDRLGGVGENPRRIYETAIHGDIILRTDGDRYGTGILCELLFNSPGRFSTPDFGAQVVNDEDDIERGQTNHTDCNQLVCTTLTALNHIRTRRIGVSGTQSSRIGRLEPPLDMCRSSASRQRGRYCA